MSSPPSTTNESDLIFTIQTDTVLESSTLSSTAGLTSATPVTDASSSFPTTELYFPTPTTGDDIIYTGTCEAPMQTGDRPFWARSGYDPFDCGANAILLNWTIYCCAGLLIDINPRAERAELCFEDMRCCSEDSATTNDLDVTACSVGSAAHLLLESSVSNAFYATASTTTTGDDSFPSQTSTSTRSASQTGSSSAASYLSPSYGLLCLLLLMHSLATRRLPFSSTP